MARQAGAVASNISHHLLRDESSSIIQPWKHYCLQGTILTYKFSILLLDITVLLAPLRQQNWHSGSGFRTKEDWQGGHRFSHGMRNKASSDTRAGLRHHLFDKGLCHPPVSHAPLPGARSKLTVHLVQGRHRASQQAPSLSARSRSGHASTAPAGNSTFLQAATAPHYL